MKKQVKVAPEKAQELQQVLSNFFDAKQAEKIVQDLLNGLPAVDAVDAMEAKKEIRALTKKVEKAETTFNKKAVSMKVLNDSREDLDRFVNYLFRKLEKKDFTNFASLKIGTHTFSLRLFSCDSRKGVCSKAKMQFQGVNKGAVFTTWVGPVDRKTMQSRLFKHLETIVLSLSRLNMDSKITIYRDDVVQ